MNSATINCPEIACDIPGRYELSIWEWNNVLDTYVIAARKAFSNDFLYAKIVTPGWKRTIDEFCFLGIKAKKLITKVDSKVEYFTESN